MLASLLHELGFSESRYLAANRDLADRNFDSEEIFIHFLSECVAKRKYFKTFLGKEANILEKLQVISRISFADISYSALLQAGLGRSVINEKYRDGQAELVANCDRLRDSDIATMLKTFGIGGRPFFGLGDSHSRLYQRMRILADGRWLVPLNMTCSAGSARGLANPEAQLKYGLRISKFFPRIEQFIRSGTPCIFKFGQVDLEYVYPYIRSLTNDTKFDSSRFKEFCLQTIYVYVDFLENLIPIDMRDKVYVCSVCPPALSDEHWVEGYIRGQALGTMSESQQSDLLEMISKIEIPNIQERTILHEEFNRALQLASEDAGFRFLHDFYHFLRPDGKQIDNKFQIKGGGKDVHVDVDEPALLMIDKILEKILRPITNLPSTGMQTDAILSSRSIKT